MKVIGEGEKSETPAATKSQNQGLWLELPLLWLLSSDQQATTTLPYAE